MKESYCYLQKLPSVIDTPYPYIGLGDLDNVTRRFDPSVVPADTEKIQDALFQIQQEIVPDEASFVATSATDMNAQLESIARYEVNRSDSHVGVIILDRYIAPQISHPSFFRLNVSRDKTGRQVRRPGKNEDVEKQYKLLHKWRKVKDFDEIIVMDDVLGVGSTLIQTIRTLKKALPQQNIRAVTGIATSGGEVWSGIEKVYEATGVMTEYLTLQKASDQTASSTGLSICNSRDMTIIGGYLQPDEIFPPRTSPHFLPFTITVPKNFTAPYNRELASDLLLSFNYMFIDFLEKRIQHPLTMQDLANAGFGIPSSNIDIVNKKLPETQPSTCVKDQLAQMHDIFVKHKTKILAEITPTQRRPDKR